METFKDALKMFRDSLDQFKLSGIYDLQNNKKVSDGYLRELLRM